MKGERLGEFEELVLLSIRAHRESPHSVAIQTVLERDAARNASLGAIYAALDRLERKGFVESWLGEPTPERGGRSKRHYRLTDGGEAALDQSREVRERMWQSEGRFGIDAKS